MLIHHYDDEDQYSFQSSKKIIPLKSIKEMFYQQSMLSENLQSLYSLRIKGMILRGLLCKKIQQDKSSLNSIFLRWYTNSCGSKHQFAINKFMTSGKIRKQKIFYLFKIFAKNQAKNCKQSRVLDQVKQRDGINNSNSSTGKKTDLKSSASKRNTHNREKAMIQMGKLMKEKNQYNQIIQKSKEIYRGQQIQQGKQNVKQNINKSKQEKGAAINNQKSKRTHHHSPGFQSSINHILLQSQSILSCISTQKQQTQQRNQCPKFSQQSLYSANKQQNVGTQQIGVTTENQKNKGSISCIDPASGDLRIQLVTCTNLFQTSNIPQHSIVSKMTSTMEIIRICQKLSIKNKHTGFRLLLQNYLQDDYQQELLKAKRNLQLVQHNFMVQCEMQAMVQNYQQQNQHLQSIDKNLQILRQKFTISRTSSIIRVLKKLIYPILKIPFIQINGNRINKQLQNLANFYQVQQLNVSSTSLSNRATSIARIRTVDYHHQARISRQLNLSKQSSRKSGLSRRFSSTKDIGEVQMFLQQNLDRCKQDQEDSKQDQY